MWDLPPQQRLAEWKLFRNNLNEFSAENALEKISSLWSYVPFVEHYLDLTPNTKWPGPWELIWNNKYCDLSRALGMMYTWQLTEHAKNYTAELRIYRDHCSDKKVNCFCVNPGGYVLNLEYNTVLKKHSFNCGFELIHTYPANKLIEI